MALCDDGPNDTCWRVRSDLRQYSIECFLRAHFDTFRDERFVGRTNVHP
jgi:hypothetical protein